MMKLSQQVPYNNQMQHSKQSGAKDIQPISISLMIRSSNYRASQMGRCQKTGQNVVFKKINYKISDRDIELYSKIRHPNIIRIIDFVGDGQADGGFFMMEYIEGRTLVQMIQNEAGLHKDEMWNIFHQICSVVQYLHSLSLCRFNIKPHHVIIQEHHVVKICYFDLQPSKNWHLHAGKNLEYLAPQILLKLPCCKKVDNWALGILLYFMIEGKTPFHGETSEQMLNSIKAMSSFSKKFTAQECKLICSLLKVKPKQRIDLSQILKLGPELQKSTKTSHELSGISTLDEQPVLEGKIKIMDVKTIDSSPGEKKTHDIQIMSIRKLGDAEESILHPINQVVSRGQKCSLSLQTKDKISLRRFTRKISKPVTEASERVSILNTHH